MKERKIGTKVA